MTDKYQDVKEWHKGMGISVGESKFDNPEFVTLARRLIVEEFRETMEALTGCQVDMRFSAPQKPPDPENFIKEIQDLIWVCEGRLVELGVNSNCAWSRVRKSNWTKVGASKDSGGKIKKGENYVPPDMTGLYDRKK